MLKRYQKPVYLDNAATTPLAPEALAAMQEHLSSDALFANASSTTHAAGRASAAAAAAGRETVASAIGAKASELVFTSGATEANNIGILGCARYRRAEGTHIISARTEHKAVHDPLRALEKDGFEVSWLTPDSKGRIDAGAVQAAIRPDTTLLSLMLVNNETGLIQELGPIIKLCREHDISVHVDAVQAFGKMPLDVRTLAVDSMAISAHKIYGPKGIGALYVNARFAPRIEPLVFGGGQERGLRPGTLPGHQIAGFAAAAQQVTRELDVELARIHHLRDRLIDGMKEIDGVLFNTDLKGGVPHIVNVSIAGVHGESLIYAMEPIAVSTGSACNSASREPSPVLRALGRSDAEAESSLRFSLGRYTKAGDVDAALAQLRQAVAHLRAAADWSET